MKWISSFPLERIAWLNSFFLKSTRFLFVNQGMHFIMIIHDILELYRIYRIHSSSFEILCRSGVRHTNVLLRRVVFRTFSINFFTYGFPVRIPYTFVLGNLYYYGYKQCKTYISKWWNYRLNAIDLIADFLACSFILDFSFCKPMCVWITRICWLHSLCLSSYVPFAPSEWLASCFHSLLGRQHIRLQRGIHSP